MNSLRPELLELTPQALTALSNAGFVKRSLKELENGNVPEISHENSALIATFSDGVRTQLANSQALKEAQCSCGASGMCRHRVMLVLSYQRLCATVQPTEKEEEWDPAIWLEELATLPDATRKRAQALVAKGITIELFCAPGEIPSARLPMSDVRFYSRSSIRFARCDCIEGTLCEHVVLAVQAFVEAKAQQAEFNHLIWQMRSEHVTSSDDPFASEEGQTCRQYVQQLSQALWLGGISQPLIHYEAAFNRALQAAEACNWRWVSESLRQLRASVDAFHTRASHYHAGECLRQLAALNSRLNCAQEMARRDSVGEVPPVPWRTVVGSGIAGEAKLDHLRLVSLKTPAADDQALLLRQCQSQRPCATAQEELHQHCRAGPSLVRNLIDCLMPQADVSILRHDSGWRECGRHQRLPVAVVVIHSPSASCRPLPPAMRG